ncbi:MAG: cobamide remodeling phosphodiesterase CbiR [Deltaproteobacteria bacterium]|nr:cobamide remodeling phosphodiesterase CbiR [Deltaproteobacteria bacterium]
MQDGSLPGLAGCFPFRLGATSYVVPADVAVNVQALAGKVDDLELVLFESDRLSDMLDDQTIRILTAAAESQDLSYTVHLPLDIRLGHDDETQRQTSVEKCLRVVDRTRILDPFAYVLHLVREREGRRPGNDVRGWLDRLDGSIRSILESGVERSALCVENLDYPLDLVEPLVEEHGLSVCLDVGHLLTRSESVESHLDRHLPRCKVVHLHGVVYGHDHRAVSNLPPSVLESVVKRLSESTDVLRVVTLEVFSESDYVRSIEAMRRFLP